MMSMNELMYKCLPTFFKIYLNFTEGKKKVTLVWNDVNKLSQHFHFGVDYSFNDDNIRGF